MKGIKECVNWMLDNPMKEIEAMGLKSMRWNNQTDCFQYKINESWKTAEYFDDLNVAEWEEVKTPYTFEEAYKLCKEEGVSFIGTGYAVDAVMQPNGKGVWIGSDHEQGMYINSNAVWFRK